MPRHRRGHGEGSIYETGDGWRGSISLGDGTREYIRGKTRAEVARKLRERQDGIDKGLPKQRAMLRLGAYLTTWLESMKPPRVRASTWRGYEEKCRVHLIPGLGGNLLVKLTPSAVEKYLQDEIAAGMSVQSAGHLRAVLRAAIGAAVRDGFVARNVAQIAKPPAKLPAREIVPFTPAQTAILLDGMKGHRLEALFLLALALGVRQGEALGLTWDAVDLAAGRIEIKRTLYRDSKGKTYRLDSMTKTLRSRRVLALPETVRMALQHHQEAQGFERKAIEGTKDEHGKPRAWANEWGLVFTRDDGAPLHYSVVLAEFQQLLDRLGLARKRFYDLRHTAASFLIAEGAELRDVMEQLGHSQISLTANTYGHLYDERKRELASLMDGKLRGLASGH